MNEFIVDRENHAYHLNGVKLDSVTDILSIFGGFDNVPADVLAVAQRFGTAVHLSTEYHDKGILDVKSLSASLIPYLDGWKNFLSDTKFEILEIEKTGYHKIHKYAFTVDRIGRYKNKLAVLDIKSGSVNSPTTALQLAGYMEGANSWVKKKIDKTVERITVWLQPDFKRGYKVIKHTDKNDINTFLCAVNVWKWGKAKGYYEK